MASEVKKEEEEEMKRKNPIYTMLVM